MGSNNYDVAFFQEQGSGSLKSAEIIFPLILNYLGKVDSLIDVGGGLGGWAACALSSGIQDVTLIDGPWVPVNELKIPKENFQAVNLELPFDINRTYDLVLCLEVAEHLPEARANSFVNDLCNLSDTVIFSAAIPFQGGTDHINEQWQSYWVKIFKSRGYGYSDVIRPELRNDISVEVWYAQNILIFQKGIENSDSQLVDYVHPRLWEWTKTNIQGH